MEQSRTCESDTRAINQEVSSPFMEPQGSLPRSEEPSANGSNMEGFAQTVASVLKYDTRYGSALTL